MVEFILVLFAVLIFISPLILLVLGIRKLLNKLNGTQIKQEENLEVYLPYRAKQYFFSRSEWEFFNILNSQLDAVRFTIFPKVRIGDFVEVEYNARYDRTWWNKIRAKHIDFLVWDLVQGKIALAIELDGNSHNSEHMIERDDFVNRLYKKVGIKLARVKVGTDFNEEIRLLTEVL